MAVLSEDESRLILMVVHRSAGAGPVDLSIDLSGFPAGPEAEVLTLRGESLSDENTLREPRRIAPQPSTLPVNDGTVSLTSAPYCLARLVVARQ